MLTVYLAQLFEFMAGGDGQPPVPATVVIAEFNDVECDRKGRPILCRARLKTVEQYSARFAELLSAGYPWLHLTYMGLLDDQGLVSLDHPKYPPRPEIVGRTSVNFAGAREPDRYTGWSAYPQIVIKD